LVKQQKRQSHDGWGPRGDRLGPKIKKGRKPGSPKKKGLKKSMRYEIQHNKVGENDREKKRRPDVTRKGLAAGGRWPFCGLIVAGENTERRGSDRPRRAAHEYMTKKTDRETSNRGGASLVAQPRIGAGLPLIKLIY